MVVKHNLTAVNADRNLNTITGRQKKNTEKLSSGYKINRAADDAAGLSISEKMRRQIRGLTQASLNTQDGISFVQSAEGALNEIHDILQRGNELAVKAANDTNMSEDREAIYAEIKQLNNEIDRISRDSRFNEMSMFDSSNASPETKNASYLPDGYPDVIFLDTDYISYDMQDFAGAINEAAAAGNCLPGVFKYGNPQNRIHLTEKPLQLMRDIVKITEPGGHILDPFAGSGTTVLAAVLEGYTATGIEVTDEYARLARERIAQELAQAA